MLLKDYIKNKELAMASEICNANFGSVEDVVVLMNKVKEESAKFDSIIQEFNLILRNIKVCLSHIACLKENLSRVNEFAKSHMAQLISKFIETQDQNIFAEIEREISENNTFDVRIIPAYEQGNGERMYGSPYCAYFHIDYCDKYYTYNNWDIDEDIAKVSGYINSWEKEINNWLVAKERMYFEHGIQTLMPLFNDFIKRNGGMAADKEWANYEIHSYEYYNEEDYED